MSQSVGIVHEPLWRVTSTGDDPVTAYLSHESTGRAGLILSSKETGYIGVGLSREGAQALRNALTTYLINTADQRRL